MRKTWLLCLFAAAALLSPLSGQDKVVTRWLLHGPLPADTGEVGLLYDHFGGERSLQPTLGEGWTGVSGDSQGRINLDEVFDQQIEWSVAYAHTYVSSPEDRNVQLIVDSDDDIVAFLNGQRVWVNNTARGLGFGRDTVTVRLATGWNGILLKVRNRSGGFGLLGRLSSADGVDLSGLTLQTDRPTTHAAHNYPQPTVAMGPLQLTGQTRWIGGALTAGCRAPIAAWGGDTLRHVELQLTYDDTSATTQTFEFLPPGELFSVGVDLSFSQLRRASLGESPIQANLQWDGGSARAEAFVDAGQLLRLIGGRLDIAWDSVESTDGAPVRLHSSLRVPAPFDGQSANLLPLGMGPDARYIINGEPREWHHGEVSLCDPCEVGDEINIDISLDAGRPLWMMPQARVREAGFSEYAIGFDYAVALAGRAPTIARPDAQTWLHSLGQASSYGALQSRYRDAYAPIAAEIRRDTLHLVGNSHIDAAWLWPWSETIDVIRNTWRTSLKLADIFPGYSFAASSAAFYHAMDSLEPTLADSLRAAADAGKWMPVGGWWVEPDFNMSSGESLARQGLYGQRYFEQNFGSRSRVAWTPDAFGYAWSVPQIFRQSGFDYFVTQKIRWNDSTEFPHNAFFWEGNDGTRILSYNPYGYTHDLDPALLVPQRIEDRERVGNHHQIVLYGVGDHGGGPTIAMLQRAEDLRRVPTFPTMKYAEPAAALDAVRDSKPAGTFPVWRDELYLEYHRGTYTSQASVKSRNRRSEAMLHTAEALATIDTASYPRTRLETAWHRVLFNQFHDILPGSSIHQVYEDADRDYDMAWAVLNSVTHQALVNLGARMDTRRRDRPVVVFNSLGWERSGAVLIPDIDGDSIRITVDQIPAYGARVIQLRDTISRSESHLETPTTGPNWLENEFLRVEIDTTAGTITRIYDKTNDRDVLATGERGNVLQVFDDRPTQWDAWNIVLTGERWDIETVRGFSINADARRAEFFVERTWGNSIFRQRLVLARESQYLEIENDFDWHEHRKMLKVAFGLNVTADSATYEIPYGTIGRSGNPRTQAERAKFEVPGQRWADVSQNDYGVSILNDSKYGWDYKGNRLRLTLLKAPIWPDSLADRGNHKFRFAVYPHAGDWRDAHTMRRAAEYNTPMLAILETEHRGELGREFSFVSTESENTEIAWIKRAEDSPNLVLRLVEWFGTGGEAKVQLGCRVQAARRANLLEDPGEPVPVEDDSFRLDLRPFEIATVLVECRQ